MLESTHSIMGRINNVLMTSFRQCLNSLTSANRCEFGWNLAEISLDLTPLTLKLPYLKIVYFEGSRQGHLLFLKISAPNLLIGWRYNDKTVSHARIVNASKSNIEKRPHTDRALKHGNQGEVVHAWKSTMDYHSLVLLHGVFIFSDSPCTF